eukprot:gene5309-477_t
MAYPPPGGGYGYPPGGGGYPPSDPMYPPGGGAYPPVGGAYPPGGPAYPPTGGAYPPAGGMPPGAPNYGAPPGAGYPQPGYGGPPPAGFNTGPPMPQSSGYGGPGGYAPPPVSQPPVSQPYGAPQPAHPYQQPPGQQYGGQPGYQQPPAQGYQQPPTQGYQQPPPQGYQQPPAPGYQQPQAQQPKSQAYQPPAQGYQQPPSRPAAQPSTTSSAPPTSQLASMSLKMAFHGTIVPKSPFDAENDCETLRKAMRGMGTDEASLIEILVTRSNAQRVEIRKKYKTMFGKDLMNDLKSELSGNLEECLLAMMEPHKLYDAKCLRRAMRGAGTDEEALIDILCTRSNQEIQDIKQEYKNYYQRDLEKDCVSETSGHFKRLLVSMCQGNREENETVNIEKAKKEANDLFQAGEKKWGTDESRFNVVLVTRSYPQLRATFDEYVKISQRDIINSIDREMSGDLKAGFRCIVLCARNAPEYFADRLWKSMKGAGTDDSTLIRVVVSRSEVDLVEIKQAFLNKYHKTLYKMIEGDCSGDYKKLLLAIVKMN